MYFRISEDEHIGAFTEGGRMYTLETKDHWWSRWKIIMASPWITEILRVRDAYDHNRK